VSSSRILNGPLVGLEGIIERRGNSNHFVAVVHFLGRGARIELKSWQIEPIRYGS
jgi:transcriptional antiterminator RfaH